MPPIQPIPCATCGGAAGGASGHHDVEDLILCDILPNGTIAGAAIAVYDYDNTTGAPMGAPTFVIPGTNTPYVAQGILQPCDEPCMKCETTILCDNTIVPASEVVASTMVMLDTVNVAGADGWNVTAYNTGNVTSVQLGDGCPSGTGPPLPVPYPAFYMADWCAAYIAACPAASPGGSGCSLNPGAALGVTSSAEGVGCAGGPTFDTACARYLVEKTFNTDAACTKIRVTSQRFRADGSAKVLIDGQDTGIYGQYNVSSPDGTITLTVAPGPHTMTIDLRDAGSPTWIQGGLTIECLDIVPASTTSVEFLHTVCRSCTGTVISAVDTTFDGTTPYVPGPNVTVCSTGTAGPVCPSCESIVLVDTFNDLSGNTFCSAFLRTVCRNCDGTVNGVKDTLLDGTSPYTPSGLIGPDCQKDVPCGTVISSGCYLQSVGPDVLLHYVAIRNCTTGVVHYYDSVTGVDVGALLTANGFATCLQTTYFEEVLCDANGVQFVRTWRTTDGGFIDAPGEFSDYLFDGSPHSPVLPVGLCKEAVECENTFELIGRCDYNAGAPGNIGFTTFFERLEWDCQGNLVSADTIKSDGTPYVVVGTAQNGICQPDIEQEVLCDSTGTQFIRRYAWATRQVGANSMPLLNFRDFALDGATTFAPVGAVGLCTTPAVTLPAVAAHHFNAVPGTPWTPAAIPAGRLTSLTYTVLSGTATVVDADGTSVAAIPAGYTATWNAQSDLETLSPPTSITADPGSRVLVLMSVATP